MAGRRSPFVKEWVGFAKWVAGNSLIPAGPSAGSVGAMSGFRNLLCGSRGSRRKRRGWADRARSIEQQGWTSLLVPDTRWTPSPFPALAVAAAVTSVLRVRTWVIAAPL